ncbi:hypothetical protein JCM8547_007251 [Rhodosporidiobolus lusitaniae]
MHRLFFLAFLAFFRPSSAAPTSQPSVTTTHGTWLGSTSSGIDSFKGIPFGKAPTGDLRFAAPVKDDTDYGERDASSFGKSCPQMNFANGVFPGFFNDIAQDIVDTITSLPLFSSIASTDASEDCLNLNVWRPTGTTADDKLPVMVWIFGGAFLIGGTSMYDPSNLISRSVSLDQPIIVVSMNYRLNSFGFLPGAESAADSSVAPNAGLMDQRLALEWVQANIASFGGNPTKVTIFGESAGGISVAFQLMAYDGDIKSTESGNDLFRAAIMQSGSPIPVGPPSYGQDSFDTLANAGGCGSTSDKIACLRALSYDEMRDATSTILALGTLNITTEAQLKSWLKEVWFPRASDDQIEQLLDYYPADITKGSPFDTGILYAVTSQSKRINALVGDLVFQAPRRAFMGYTNSTQNTWSYASRAWRATPFLGSFHFSDVLAVFGLDLFAPSEEMQTRWINFAYNLDPNVNGWTNWPQYGSSASLLQFTDTSSSVITDNYRAEGIAYIWAQVDDFTL